jgi:hypothetical protein
MGSKDVISEIIGKGIALLMIFFLGLVGVTCLLSAVEFIYPGPFDFGKFSLTLIAGFTFGGAGLGILYSIFLREAISGWYFKYRQDRYGDRPWRLKREWRKGRITYRPPSPVVFLWIFSVIWNGTLGFIFTVNRFEILEAIRENWLNALGVAVFVLVGLGVLYAALRMTFTRKVSGWAVFTMDSMPGVIGGKLRGSIQTRIPCNSIKQVTLKLSSSSSAPFERKISREQMQEAPPGLKVPVDFDIPDSCSGTNDWDPDHKVVWTLKALAHLGSETWEASFDVPLFKVQGPEA